KAILRVNMMLSIRCRFDGASCPGVTQASLRSNKVGRSSNGGVCSGAKKVKNGASRDVQGERI
ncbi:MAG: hypothetical protein ACTHN2_02630, partial [Nitrobacter sp.]